MAKEKIFVCYIFLYRKSNSQGFKPVCFLNAVEKCEMEEYPNSKETSVTLNPFSYNRYLACSIR